jgi:hypothetical protein
MLENMSLKNVFLLIARLALSYLRNASFVTSATMIFVILVIVQIFFQDELDVNAFGQIIMALEKIPFINGYVDMSEGSYNEKDIASFFLRLSFVFTIFTEIIYYIKRYILKKEPAEAKWVDLKKRALFVFLSITILSGAVFSYIALQTGGVLGVILIAVIFWLIAIASSLAFLLFDFLARRLEELRYGRKIKIDN